MISISDGGLVFTFTSSLARRSERHIVAVSQINCFLSCPTQRTSRMNQCRWILQSPHSTTISSQSIKVATTSDSRSLFHFFTFLHPPLLATISRALGQLTSQEFMRPNACRFRGDGSTSIQQNSRFQGYPPLPRLTWQGVLCGSYQ